jgi:hypothetical protein
MLDSAVAANLNHRQPARPHQRVAVPKIAVGHPPVGWKAAEHAEPGEQASMRRVGEGRASMQWRHYESPG